MRCPVSDLPTGSCDVRSVLIRVCLTLCTSSQSEGQTSLNDVSAVVGRKEGWTDRRHYLSLINLGDGVEKCCYLINKRDTAYAFPYKLASSLRRCEDGRGGVGHRYLDRRT